MLTYCCWCMHISKGVGTVAFFMTNLGDRKSACPHVVAMKPYYGISSFSNWWKKYAYWASEVIFLFIFIYIWSFEFATLSYNCTFLERDQNNMSFYFMSYFFPFLVMGTAQRYTSRLSLIFICRSWITI